MHGKGVCNVTRRALLLKKLLSIVLVLSFIFPVSLIPFPQQASAQFVPTFDSFVLEELIVANVMLGTIDVSTALIAEATVQLEIKETILDGIVYALINTIISYISDSLVNWINSGFNGSPGFVQDPARFFTDIVDSELGNFIASTDFGFLCNGFNIDIRAALNLNFATGNFKRRNNCTLTQVVNNVQNGFQDLSTNGWDGWLSMTAVPQNNIYGAYIVAETEAAVRIGNKTFIDSKILDWGRGFLSQGVNGVIKTPGAVIENQINNALGSGQRRVEVADEISEILGALMNQLMSTALRGLSNAAAGSQSAISGRTGGVGPAPNISDADLTGTRAGGNVTGQEITFTGGPGTTTYGGPGPAPINNTPPPGQGPANQPATTTTLVGKTLTGAEVNGNLYGANIRNIVFTPEGGILKVQATAQRPVTTVGRVRVRAGSIWLCRPAGCSAANPPVLINNIATEVPGGIEITVAGGNASMQSASGLITADPTTGRSIGISVDNVNVSPGPQSFNTPNITNAKIVQATIIGDITSTDVEGGRITSGRAIVAGNPLPPRAHIEPDSVLQSANLNSPIVYNVGTTQNVSHIETGFLRGGAVNSGSVTTGPLAGTNLTGFTVAVNVTSPTGGNIPGSTVSNIQGVAGVNSTGGIIATGATRSEGDLFNDVDITGIITKQGTVQ